jgi:hypothetical protein
MVETPPVDLPVASGARAWLAVAAAIAGLVVFALEAKTGAGGSGGGGIGIQGRTVEYEWDGGAAGWWDVGFPAAAFAILLAAIVLWVTRRRVALAVALMLLVAGPVVAFNARQDKKDAGFISRSEGRSISVGMREAEVRRVLGAPMTHGEWRRRGEHVDCLIYFTGGPHGGPDDRIFGFCIEGGRVVARGES